MSAHGMPPHLLALFAPRPPLEYLKPLGKKKVPIIAGIADFVENLEDTLPPPRAPFETPRERRARLHEEKLSGHAEQLEVLKKSYDPHKDPVATGDPFRTLFVGRTCYETTEKKLKKEFETFGPIRKIRVVTDRNGKPRGYAFIEFESDRDMKEAYKHADGRKIDGRRILVDVERGRTVLGWVPRRLGGGRGPARYATAPLKRAPPLPRWMQQNMMPKDDERERRGGNVDSSRRDRPGGPGPDPYLPSGGGSFNQRGPPGDFNRRDKRQRPRSRSRDRERDERRNRDRSRERRESRR